MFDSLLCDLSRPCAWNSRNIWRHRAITYTHQLLTAIGHAFTQSHLVVMFHNRPNPVQRTPRWVEWTINKKNECEFKLSVWLQVGAIGCAFASLVTNRTKSFFFLGIVTFDLLHPGYMYKKRTYARKKYGLISMIPKGDSTTHWIYDLLTFMWWEFFFLQGFAKYLDSAAANVGKCFMWTMGNRWIGFILYDGLIGTFENRRKFQLNKPGMRPVILCCAELTLAKSGSPPSIGRRVEIANKTHALGPLDWQDVIFQSPSRWRRWRWVTYLLAQNRPGLTQRKRVLFRSAVWYCPSSRTGVIWVNHG